MIMKTSYAYASVMIQSFQLSLQYMYILSPLLSDTKLYAPMQGDCMESLCLMASHQAKGVHVNMHLLWTHCFLEGNSGHWQTYKFGESFSPIVSTFSLCREQSGTSTAAMISAVSLHAAHNYYNYCSHKLIQF